MVPKKKRPQSPVTRFIITAALLVLVVMTGLGLSKYHAGGLRLGTFAGFQARHLIYAAQDNGKLAVYDMDAGHRLVKTITLFTSSGADMRGVTAAAPTHRFYAMYNLNNAGHLVAVDLLTDRVLWDHVMHVPGIDRGNITPDGKTIYLPTWENDDNTPYEVVVDALAGTEIGRIALPVKSHDTIVSLDGKFVLMETKSATAAMYVADTSTNQIVQTISGYCCGGVLAPFAINGKHTLVVNDVNDYAGFQLASITTGRVLASVPFVGEHGGSGHGIAWTPNEREVWVNDGGISAVHVYDMTTQPPQQTHVVTTSHDGPHWLTFSIDGRYAYVAGRKGQGDVTDIVDTVTYARVGSLVPSEDLLEVDLRGAIVTQVGNQFGIGRVTQP
ncbi:MAG: beta-propeller fold lactonase family protein [Ktedonobacterales bacterium]|nr:beta-propeller fold lactonase family protein [Ktedonobacterales bacterium]